MTREPLSGLVLRCYDDKAYLVHDRATGGPLGSPYPTGPVRRP